MDQHQIGGLAANAPANEETKTAGNAPAKWNNTKLVGSVGNAPAKWNNTKSVAARWGMRRPNGRTPNRWRLGGECTGQTEQHQFGGSVANAPANEEIVARRWDAPKENAARLWDAPAERKNQGLAKDAPAEQEMAAWWWNAPAE
jgi:hypothetical protein